MHLLCVSVCLLVCCVVVVYCSECGVTCTVLHNVETRKCARAGLLCGCVSHLLQLRLCSACLQLVRTAVHSAAFLRGTRATRQHHARHVQKARKSTHRFASAAALKEQLLYNHVPTHNETQTGGYFYEVYVFPFSPPSAANGGSAEPS